MNILSPGRLDVVYVAGVDACPTGWVSVLLDDGQLSATLAAPALAEIVDAWPAPG